MALRFIHATLPFLAASINVKRSNSSQLPFDCYLDKGAEYEGLQSATLSGRKCKNWLSDGTYSPAVKGVGNHNYCRNPEGSKDKPWCFTMDPKVAWEYCTVSACSKDTLDTKPWTAPAGAKSKGADAKGPCKYSPPQKAGYTTFMAGRACMDNQGDKWWLITNNKTKVADVKACKTSCKMLPGADYMTFFSSGTKGNCGCYRDCIPVLQNETIGSPTSYKLD